MRSGNVWQAAHYLSLPDELMAGLLPARPRNLLAPETCSPQEYDEVIITGRWKRLVSLQRAATSTLDFKAVAH